MRKFALIACLVLTFAGPRALASPFLVSDPSPEKAEYFQVRIDGQEMPLEKTIDYRIIYDLRGISTARHTVQLRFGKMRINGAIEWSDWEPKGDTYRLYKEKDEDEKLVHFPDGWWQRKILNLKYTFFKRR